MFSLRAAWGEVPKANNRQATGPLSSDRSLCRVCTTEAGARAHVASQVPVPGASPKKARDANLPRSRGLGGASNRREAVGLCGCPVSRGAQPYPSPPYPRYRPIPSRTHQLLQVLLRELRVAVPLLLELVAGGFRHHHHPRGAEAAVGAATAARQLARLPVPQVPPAVRARAPQSRPATRHAPAAAQQEAPVASHGPRGCGCRLALPAASTTPGAQRLSAETCVESATRGADVPRRRRGRGAPETTRGGGGRGAGNGAGLRVVGFICLFIRFLPAPAHWPLGPAPPPSPPSSPLCARPQAAAVSQSEFGEVWEPEMLQGLAVAGTGQEFYLAFELPEEIQLEPV